MSPAWLLSTQHHVLRYVLSVTRPWWYEQIKLSVRSLLAAWISGQLRWSTQEKKKVTQYENKKHLFANDWLNYLNHLVCWSFTVSVKWWRTQKCVLHICSRSKRIFLFLSQEVCCVFILKEVHWTWTLNSTLNCGLTLAAISVFSFHIKPIIKHIIYLYVQRYNIFSLVLSLV